MGPFQRIRELVATLRDAAQAAQRERDGDQPMPPIGARGGQPARPPARPAPAPEADSRHEDLPEPQAQPAAPTRRARIGRWIADPHALADAVVLREILGPPVALRRRNQGRNW